MSEFYKFIRSMEGKGIKEKLLSVDSTKNDTWGELFRLMLCPSIKYNITKMPTWFFEMSDAIYRTDEDLIEAIHDLCKRDLRGNALRNALGYIYVYSTKELRPVLSWIIARKNPAKIGKTIVNAAYPNLIRTQKYMGAVPGTDKALERLFDSCPLVNVQIKEDGMAVLVEYKEGIPISIHTRQGQDITRYFPTFLSRLADAHEFSGEVHHELFVSGLSRAEGNGKINKAVKGGNSQFVDNCLHSVILDVYTIGTQNQRYYDMWFFENDYSRRVVQKTCDSLKGARKYAKTVIQSGGEGVVCKDPKGLFKNGKPWYNVKIKNEFVVDLICIDTKPHRTKAGQIGALLMTTSDSKLEVWVNLKTDDDRRRSKWDYLQWVFRVQCESVTTSNGKKKPSLYLGRFYGNNRDEYICDKTVADSYQEVLDQEAMSRGLK